MSEIQIRETILREGSAAPRLRTPQLARLPGCALTTRGTGSHDRSLRPYDRRRCQSSPDRSRRYPADDNGGTCGNVIDFSNTRSTRRPLSSIEVIEQVAEFLRTGDKRHLPPELRGEAEGIKDLVRSVRQQPEPPWPTTAARPRPGPGASIGEQLRALVGDEAADAPSGFEPDGTEVGSR